MGCDDRGAAYCRPSVNFNPRTHMGCDGQPPLAGEAKKYISIHAPTWGATGFFALTFVLGAYFNPRTHMGCDSNRGPLPEGCKLFQSTHPHGVRLVLTRLFHSAKIISIHAPTWGATRAYTTKLNKLKISIHAPTWGATEGLT